MSKISLERLPEVFVSSHFMTKDVSHYLKLGLIRKLASKLYTKNLNDGPEEIIKRNLWFIVSSCFPGALISDRTALENRPAADGSIFLISTKKRDLVMPGVTIRPRKGHAPLASDRRFIGDLFLSSQVRAILENMTPSRSRKNQTPRKFLRKEMEVYLDGVIRTGGAEAINKIREEAHLISHELGLTEEYKNLDALIGTLLGTRNEEMQSSLGMARKRGFPYDPKRVDLFQSLQQDLLRTFLSSRPCLTDFNSYTTIAFFESYFSNFIEGTEFELKEAYDILYEGKIPKDRPQDAHDIMGTFKLVSDKNEMQIIPETFSDFQDILKKRHAKVMEGRPEQNPGLYKKISNRAGSTLFVQPDLVMGTLQVGFEFYASLEAPISRAIFMMFLVAEVHPFTDGNGRLARVMMNAELIRAKEHRIIIPTIYRNNYLSALRALSLNKITDPLLRTLDFAQKYTAHLDFSTFEAARLDFETTNAFMDPNEAESQGIRLTLPAHLTTPFKRDLR